MKTLYNFLDPETIEMAWGELHNLRRKKVWSLSSHTWHDDLFKGSVVGNVAQSTVSTSLAERIIDKLAPYIPPSSRIDAQHYLWHPLSGINTHSDSISYTFSATIYLTQEWNINWGGLFVYNEGEGLGVTFPHFNSVNIIEDKTDHMVTTVSPLAPHPRYTLQIRGLK